ncbi:MAG: caspase family protein [Elusimicrobia bacterium]|nr:caspase family protein [Elusimicrobiota bacterium]
MKLIVAVVSVLAALGAAGCGAPLLVGAPGQLRSVQVVQPEDGTSANPALCAGAVNDVDYYTFNHGLAYSFNLLTVEHPELTGCDLVVSIFQAGSSIFHRAEIQAYSAYTGALSWQGSGSGTAGILGSSTLIMHLLRDFAPGQALRQKLDEEAASGRRITAEDLARSGMTLLSEAKMSKKDLEYVTKIRQVAAGRVRSLAPRAPAPSSAAAPAHASAPRVASDLDALPAAAPVSPRRHALVIGIERYREKLPPADFAAGDAKLAAEYFKRVLGVPEQNVAVLIDERATKGDFEKYFERWLPNRVEAGDEVFVYFSGHGSPNPAKGDAYLVPYDGDPTYIDQTGYPLARLYEGLAKLPAKSVTVAMDSCFSGAGGRSVLAKGARPLVTVSTVEALPAKITVLSASAGDQISNSYQEKGHGLFTYFLLKGLKEKGPDMKGVFEYLKPEVARTARRELNSDQDPQWREGK